jgi:peptidoglycan-associated lipoprotein
LRRVAGRKTLKRNLHPKPTKETTMVRRMKSSSLMKLALVSVAAASMAACASKPKPLPTQPTAPPAAPPATPTPPPGEVSQQPTGPLPGSTQDFVINVGDRVYFDTDRYDIRADAQPILDAQSAWLRQYPGVQVRIEGNADERGTREYNLALGDRRASAAKNYLVARGISPNRIATLSYGKERPAIAASGEQAWAQNRRAVTQVN